MYRDMVIQDIIKECAHAMGMCEKATSTIPIKEGSLKSSTTKN